MKVFEGNPSQIPPRASTMGFSLSFCLGPLAQRATSRPVVIEQQRRIMAKAAKAVDFIETMECLAVSEDYRRR
jgi:hypothetical protein